MPKVSQYHYYFLTVLILIIFCVAGFFYIQKSNKSASLFETNNEYKINAKELDSIILKKDTPSITLNDKSLNLSLQYSSQNNSKINSEIVNKKSVVYKNIEEGVDLKYTPLDNGIKEDIVIKSKDSIQNNPDVTYSFLFTLKGFKYTEDSDGNISTTFVSKSNSRDVYTIQPAFMVDNKNVRSDDVQTVIKKYNNNDEFIITLIPNKGWLINKEREYPVTIDPTIVKGTASSLSLNLDENTGQYAYDSSGNSNTATLGSSSSSESSDPTWKNSEYCVDKNCLYFDGTDDKFTVTGSASYSSNTTTFSFWMRGAPYLSGGGWDLVIAKGDNSTKGWYLSRNSTTNDLTLRVDTSGGFNQYGKANISSVFDNNWHYITYVIDNSGTITSYKDGQYANSSSFTPGSGVGSNSIDLGVGYNSASSVYYKGFIDNLRIYSYARTAAQIKQDYLSQGRAQTSAKLGSESTKFLTDGLVGYWKMDEASDATRIDFSGNGNDLTESTSDTIVQASGKYGFSGDFERGDTEYLTIPDASQNGLDLSTNKFTWSAWINVESTAGGYEGILTKADSNGQMSYAFATFNGVNRLKVWLDDDGWAGGTTEIITGNDIFTIGEWAHFVVTYDGSYIRLYKNGVEQTSGNFPYAVVTTIHQGTSAFELGRWGGQAEYFDGKLDEVRVYNRALSAMEVSNLYNYAPGPVAYWKMDEGTGTTNIYDSSGNNNTGTMNGSMTQSDWVPGKFGRGLDFDGVDDKIIVANSTSISNLPTTNFSAGAWIKLKSLPPTDSNLIIAGRSRNDDHIWHFSVTNVSGTNYFNASLKNTAISRTTGITIQTDVWYYFYITYNDTTDRKVHIYINGVESAYNQQTAFSGSYGTDNTYDSNSDMAIGAFKNTAGNFPGIIDDLKLYNYIRTPSQIIEDMNGGHPVGGSPIGSQVAYYKFDTANGTTAYDWSINANNLTLSTASWTTSGKFGAAWNGTNANWLSRSDDSDFDFAAADSFTISGWFKSDSASNPGSTEYLVNKANATTAGYAMYFNTSGQVCFGIDDDTSWGPDVSSCSSADYYDGTWHNFIAIRDTASDQTKIYVDASLKDSDTDPTTATLENSLSFYIGDRDGTNNGDEFTGDVDELKIYRTALTEPQVKTEFNRGSAIKLGSLSTTTPGVGDDSAARSYCVPGDTSTCNAPVAVWSFDEGTGTTIADKSGNGYNITTFNNINNDANDGWRSGKIGKAYQFDGTDDNVQVATSNFSFVGSSNFSIETWVKVETFNTSYSRIITYKQDASNGYHLTVVANNAGVCPSQFLFEVDKAATYYAAGCSASNTTPSTNTWYHLVATFNDATNTPLLYVNGVLQQGTATKSVGLGVATTLTFASQSTVGTNTLDGYIDETRIYNYVRTSEQVAWSYNRGAPTLWYKFDEGTGTSIGDWAPAANGGFIGNTGTLTLGASGVTSSSTAWSNGSNGVINSAMSFDGSDDYVSIGNISALYPTSNGFSIAFWAKATTWPSAIASIFSKYATSPANGQYYVGVYQQKVRSSVVGTGGTKISNSQNTLTDNAWAHIVATWTGSSTAPILIYVNGKLDTSTETNQTITAFTSSSESNLIGARNSAAPAAFFTGLIDDVRYYNYDLTPQQVQDIYNNGAVSFK